MDKRLRNGLWLLFGAVLLMPLAFVFPPGHAGMTALLLLAMLIELAGLVLVVMSLLKRRSG